MHTLRRVPLFLIPIDRKNNENPSNATTKELVKLRHGPCESASEGSLLNLHLGKTQQINPKGQHCKTWMKVCWCTKWNQSFAWISRKKPLFVDYPWIWNKKRNAMGTLPACDGFSPAICINQPSCQGLFFGNEKAWHGIFHGDIESTHQRPATFHHQQHATPTKAPLRAQLTIF